MFPCSLRSQQPISSDAFFCYKSVILQQDIERVFVLFWLGLANLIAVFWHPQCVEENLNAIVNVAARTYNFAGGVSPKEQDIKLTTQRVLLCDYRNEAETTPRISARNCFNHCAGMSLPSRRGIWGWNNLSAPMKKGR